MASIIFIYICLFLQNNIKIGTFTFIKKKLNDRFVDFHFEVRYYFYKKIKKKQFNNL